MPIARAVELIQECKVTKLWKRDVTNEGEKKCKQMFKKLCASQEGEASTEAEEMIRFMREMEE